MLTNLKQPRQFNDQYEEIMHNMISLQLHTTPGGDLYIIPNIKKKNKPQIKWLNTKEQYKSIVTFTFKLSTTQTQFSQVNAHLQAISFKEKEKREFLRRKQIFKEQVHIKD